ncbi:hypothetical protein, variant [Aphanomyces invadans]|uniref:Leucine-rich repeat-containing N-terminal plant-type domain-containing protein n=1 Tax=Aphanomyces invadans TaxID=157072 RepID=A0A024TKK3_9STRA|nr:hypothetical protein, variant [Aphanomyces invadans]ETV94524.1 hypothetical protein, variant [Aphanomyces invadans]|eukprot:XP_008876839.1 hypothetical protein, variant [Aphanomyces invadans]
MQLVMWPVALTLLQAAQVRARNFTALWGLCPETIVDPSEKPMCVQTATGGYITFSKAMDDVDLSARGIQVVGSLPNDVVSLNLANNSIHDVPAYIPNSQLTRLDLAFNSLSQTSTLALPPSVTTLDLSHNFFTQLLHWSALDNSAITKLVLKNNALTMIRETTFPLSLMELDLTGNPILSFDVSSATFALLTKPNFVLKLDKPASADIVTTCVGIPMLLPNTNTYLCVNNGGHDDIAAMAFSFLSKYAIILVALFAIVLVLRWYLRPRLENELMSRDTYLSSNCNFLDNDPIQYRQTVSVDVAAAPSAAQRTRPASNASALSN